MAKKRYEADYILNLNKTINSLQKAKEQAEEFDGIMSSIGDRGNLNNLIKYFMGLDDVVDALRQNTDDLMSDLGDSLKGGYIQSLDKTFEKLAEVAQKTKTLLEGVGTLDITDPDATKKLEAFAVQINDIFKAFNIKGSINLNNFLAKPLEEQRDRIVQSLKALNKDINTTLGNINVGTIQGEFKDAFDGAKAPIKEFSAEVQAEIDKLEEQNKRLLNLKKQLAGRYKLFDDIANRRQKKCPRRICY